MDKSLLNIAGLVAFVLGILCCLTIVGAIVGVPMIIGGNKLREMSNLSDEDLVKNKETLLVWTIVLLFICTISGILALVFYVQLENPNLFSGGSKSNSSKYNELEQINKLYKDKVLSKEEYEKEKDRILNGK